MKKKMIVEEPIRAKKNNIIITLEGVKSATTNRYQNVVTQRFDTVNSSGSTNTGSTNTGLGS